MSLKSLSNHELHMQAVSLADKERQTGIEILHHLREIEQRRYYAVLGYGSLWKYCIKELKYSDGAAQRRISSMRLLKELPSVETQLQDGSLNLSALAQAQQFFREQQKTINRPISKETKISEDANTASSADSEMKFAGTTEQKQEILKSLENKSTREIEKIFATLAPKEIPEESSRQLTTDKVEVRFVIDNQCLEKIKNLAAGALGMNATYGELWQWMVNKILKSTGSAPKKCATPKIELAMQPKTANSVSLPAPAVKNQATQPSDESTKPSRYIPVAVRCEVFERDKQQCRYFDSITGRRCTETRGLEIDHVIVYARGGRSDPDNLRLRCRAHNLLHAEQTFGASWMAQHYK